MLAVIAELIRSSRYKGYYSIWCDASPVLKHSNCFAVFQFIDLSVTRTKLKLTTMTSVWHGEEGMCCTMLR